MDCEHECEYEYDALTKQGVKVFFPAVGAWREISVMGRVVSGGDGTLCNLININIYSACTHVYIWLSIYAYECDFDCICDCLCACMCVCIFLHCLAHAT